MACSPERRWSAMTKTNYILFATISILLQSHLCAFAQGAPDGAQIAISSPTNSMTALQQARAEAKALFMASQFEQAVNKWTAICRASGGCSYDYYWLGESHYHLEKYAEAAQSFEYALQKGPMTEMLFSRLAETYFALKQYEQVKSTCTNGLNVARDPFVRKQLEVYLKLAGTPMPVPQRNKEQRRGKPPANG